MNATDRGAARHLIILRHAKAAWPDVPDRDRPLAPRGRADAAAAGAWLAKARYTVDWVVCSPARRTVETWELAAPAVPRAPRVVYDERVYGASVATLVEVLRETPADVGCALLIGHNPGMQLLAATLGERGKGDALDRIREKFPTGGIAVLAVRGAWSALGPGRASIVGFSVARG